MQSGWINSSAHAAWRWGGVENWMCLWKSIHKYNKDKGRSCRSWCKACLYALGDRVHAWSGSSTKILLLNRTYWQLPVGVWKLEYRLNTNINNKKIPAEIHLDVYCAGLQPETPHSQSSVSRLLEVAALAQEIPFIFNKPATRGDLCDLWPAEAIIRIWTNAQIAYFLCEWLLYWFINLSCRSLSFVFLLLPVITSKPLQPMFGNAHKP